MAARTALVCVTSAKLSVAFAVVLSAMTANAAVIDPVAASASSSLTNRGAISTISGNGLDPSQSNVLLAGHNESPEVNSMWLTNNTTTGTITFDLGGLYHLSSAFVWNYGEVAFSNGTSFTSRGAHNVNVEASATNPNPGPADLVQTMSFSQANPANSTTFTPNPFWGLDYNVPGVNYAFTTQTAAVRYVTFNITSNWGDTGYVGLSEVRFIGTPAPEPASFVLCGLGAIGLFVAARRRRNAQLSPVVK